MSRYCIVLLRSRFKDKTTDIYNSISPKTAGLTQTGEFVGDYFQRGIHGS